ncbi:cell division protein ZipA C-terminal FtsZ-binding domain-containing protein [Halorhodospira halophila]|uniref:Cell division protein ZipA n=1 Tax=Halorhodospira halophila (strain DSM 244 / SL1) TaxID=349124 RepID=A1WY81_HALHL|nr:cell division protein ZipA C-terminal FtsZ-binding domain-containing protein [Halorhodospira halophila]ABM62643.1 cell division protein ZipA [Halorhodospira halophila SL1]
MDAMRWTILGVGVLVLLAIYAFGRWRDRRRRSAQQEPAPGGSERAAAGGGRATGGGVGGAGTDGPADDVRPGKTERPLIDDDELRGLDDLLAEQEELAPEELDLGLDLGERPASGRAASTHADEQGGAGPWWQNGDDAAGDAAGPAEDRSASPRRSAAAEAARAGLAPAEQPPQTPDDSGQPAHGTSSVAEPQPADRAGTEPALDTSPGGGEPGAEAAPREAAPESAKAGVGSPSRTEEPKPLKLSPASQVEIAAYRSGDVQEAEKILVVFVAAREGERFLGPAIDQALRRVRMVPGEHRIWHRRGQSETGRVTLFSAASMVEPGYLDPEETLPTLETPGLVFFMQLPLPVDGEQVLDAMLATAYQVSVELGGDLLDSTRSTMTQQIAEHMREQLREHRRQLHIAVHKRS